MKFNIGTTSDIYPNNLISTINGLKKLVECVQINLFNSTDITSLLTGVTVDALNQIAGECDINYLVHMPLDLDICSQDDELRKQSVEQILNISNLVNSINPAGYIIHLERFNVSDEELWIDNTFGSLDRIYKEIPKNKLLIENLGSYRSKFIHPIIDYYSSFICLDISHAIKAGESWKDIYQKYSSRISAVHLYGPDTQDGHQGLQKYQREFVSDVINILINTNYNKTVLLEVFNEIDFFESKKIVEQEISNYYRNGLYEVG